MEEQYILKQLFAILKKLEMSDPHSIRSVQSLVQFVLKNGCLMEDVVETVFGKQIEGFDNCHVTLSFFL